jgi:hypothetical protein
MSGQPLFAASLPFTVDLLAEQCEFFAPVRRSRFTAEQFKKYPIREGPGRRRCRSVHHSTAGTDRR